MLYGYGLLTGHIPTLRATAMGGGGSPFLTSLYAVYKAESNANDSLGAYNATAVGGLTYASGKSGNAFKFNGTTSAVAFPTNMFNSFVGDFSISAWIYVPSGYVGGNQINIINNFWAPGWPYNFKGFAFMIDGNALLFRIADGSSYNGNSGIYDLSYAVTFTTNTWYHVLATRKGSTRSRLYLNGALVASDTNVVNPVMNATMTPQIGRMYIAGVQDGYYAPANTMVDELLPYTKELTATEVTNLYNSSVGKFYPTF
jgi:hypothetical protein